MHSCLYESDSQSIISSTHTVSSAVAIRALNQGLRSLYTFIRTRRHTGVRRESATHDHKWISSHSVGLLQATYDGGVTE